MEKKKQKEQVQKQKAESKKQKGKKGYIIVTDDYLEYLENKVSDRIKEGYTPLGGFKIVEDEKYNHQLYAQAMVYSPMMAFGGDDRSIEELRASLKNEAKMRRF